MVFDGNTETEENREGTKILQKKKKKKTKKKRKIMIISRAQNCEITVKFDLTQNKKKI